MDNGAIPFGAASPRGTICRETWEVTTDTATPLCASPPKKKILKNEVHESANTDLHTHSTLYICDCSLAGPANCIQCVMMFRLWHDCFASDKREHFGGNKQILAQKYFRIKFMQFKILWCYEYQLKWNTSKTFMTETWWSFACDMLVLVVTKGI